MWFTGHFKSLVEWNHKFMGDFLFHICRTNIHLAAHLRLSSTFSYPKDVTENIRFSIDQEVPRYFGLEWLWGRYLWWWWGGLFDDNEQWVVGKAHYNTMGACHAMRHSEARLTPDVHKVCGCISSLIYLCIWFINHVLLLFYKAKA